ncbi:hypothetical protein LVD17_27590 [Fulvivirga ulvae]|uniref:hypothetical protein n=1 Tax=Fulvivirga ulvae TaxID=2904245 RepID=UPI001F272CCB|nr:hypothetical protein [Fulvivirga ulvae]UII32051.1 hypothetical protein LVD17_27590 [Fulvivirga ulvae]
MNKIIKIVFLIVMLAIPLAIFIFLRIFGENRFDIPVYYADGVDKAYTGCTFTEGRFLVPDSLTEGNTSLFMFFKDDGTYNLRELDNQLSRLTELFVADTPKVTIFATDSLPGSELHITYLPKESMKMIMTCALVTDVYNQFILVDKEGQVRGYYDTDLDEIDRLVVEIKILLENGARK